MIRLFFLTLISSPLILASNHLSYQKGVEWTDETDLLWKWLKVQRNRNVVTFCRHDSITGDDCDVKGPMPIIGPFTCLQSETHVTYQGAFDKDKLPKGNGRMTSNPYSTKGEDVCFDLQEGIEHIHGKFVKGKLSGKGSLTYATGATLDGNFLDGRLHGKVRLFTKRGDLLAVGRYEHGLPHGPFWIYSNVDSFEQFAQVHFDRGQIVAENTLLVDLESDWAMRGKLVNASLLQDASKVDLDWVGEYKCLQVIRISHTQETTIEDRIISPEIASSLLRLPFKLVVQQSQLTVKPSQMLYFNRIAKTGSQSFTRLLIRQGEKLGFEVKPKIHQTETLADSAAGVSSEVASVLATDSPMVFIRHYNFINFEKHSSGGWRPDWFNIVRDPIDKIVSWFYYWRAAWNVVSRQKAFPNEPLPDIDFLRKDFDTCVLSNDPECSYEQDSDAAEANDHRSQVMQFCGHEPICRKFNNLQALQIAKANVEKYFPVVGITDNINMTLMVAEQLMPQYFQGAFKMYHQSPDIAYYQMRNAYKLPVSDVVLAKVSANFTNEIEFYQFCKQRLTAQYEHLFA